MTPPTGLGLVRNGPRAGAPPSPATDGRPPALKSLRRACLFALGLPKTLLFNLRYFPLRTALKLPVWVSHRVWLMELAGEVRLARPRPGGVKIGFGDIGIFDQHRSRSIWQVTGRVDFGGTADLGHGTKIAVSGALVVGNRVIVAAESAIVAQHEVCIGDDALISWDVLIIDTDGHGVYDAAGRRINAPMPVRIGNAVWIGCRSVVLKGVEIADGVVVAAASTLTRSVEVPNAMVGGSPAKIIRENIRWKR